MLEYHPDLAAQYYLNNELREMTSYRLLEPGENQSAPYNMEEFRRWFRKWFGGFGTSLKVFEANSVF